MDRVKFAKSPGIKLTVWDKPPFDALERDLVKFGYVENRISPMSSLLLSYPSPIFSSAWLQ